MQPDRRLWCQKANPFVEGAYDESSGALTLFDALNKQLALKLDTVKRPVQVLVIDKVERKALEN